MDEDTDLVALAMVEHQLHDRRFEAAFLSAITPGPALAVRLAKLCASLLLLASDRDERLAEETLATLRGDLLASDDVG